MKEFLKEQLERTNYWLSFSEAKNGGMVALNIAIIAVCTQVADIPFIIQTIICCIFFCSTIICLLSFYSNLKNKIGNKKKESINGLNLLFYSDVAKIKDADTYLNALKDNYELEILGTEKKLYYDLITEIIINSEITVFKYIMFNKAMFVDTIGVVILIISFVVA